MNQIRKISLILSLSITFLFISVILYFSNLKLTSQQANTKEELVSVVVANYDIKVNSVIKKEELKEISIPKQYIVAGNISSIEDIAGKTSKEDIYTGEQILHKNIYEGSDEERFSYKLPVGYRAMTLMVDSVNGIAGNIKNGDYIDILALFKTPYTTNETVKTVFENVYVVEFKGSNDNYLLTIYMKPEDINKLFLYQETGKVKVSLRQISDRNVNSMSSVDTTILK